MTDDIPEQKQSSSKNSQVIRWRCPNCGQTIFTAPDDEPPDICAFCRDMTTWRRVREGKRDEKPES